MKSLNKAQWLKMCRSRGVIAATAYMIYDACVAMQQAIDSNEDYTIFQRDAVFAMQWLIDESLGVMQFWNNSTYIVPQPCIRVRVGKTHKLYRLT